jgi:hypothetical protein
MFPSDESRFVYRIENCRDYFYDLFDMQSALIFSIKFNPEPSLKKSDVAELFSSFQLQLWHVHYVSEFLPGKQIHLEQI